MRHLRIAGAREWSAFPERPDAARLEVRFDAPPNPGEQTLRLRQQDVKQTWTVTLNDRELGRLTGDENDMVVYFRVPAGTLRGADNLLEIEQDVSRQQTPDDIRVGEVALDPRPLVAVLGEARLEVRVEDDREGGGLPSRLTVVDRNGALQTVGAESNDRLAVRAGTVYTADGNAGFGLPAGEYTVYAGRGFEYSLARQSVRLDPGDEKSIALAIHRQVPTEGWVACDTHVHTYTYSRHGDATLDERLITLAAEGIELPIATDHNQHVDFAPRTRALGLSRYFTPVAGNEVTTPTAHFNVFPVAADAPPADYRSPEWGATLDGIFAAPGVKVAILNHARDLHGVRPFDPTLYNAAVGESLGGQRMGFNAMEIVNSSATQTNPLRLLDDWMTLLNRGLHITPVGSSDSHDVARHFVGQGRTYIRADDAAPGAIDVEQAVDNFIQGRVAVSYGLLTELTVDGKYGPGEFARVAGDQVRVDLRVLGPDWVSADRVLLYADGEVIREEKIGGKRQSEGVLWTGGWTLARPRHDVALVAVALGPGIEEPYWRTAKPYQPESPDWTSQVVGASGPIWLDGDADGRRMSAYDYAERAVNTEGDVWKNLAQYDEAAATQAAGLLTQRGVDLETYNGWRAAAEPVNKGVAKYLEARRGRR